MKSTMEHFFVPNIFLGEYSETCRNEFEISGARMDEVCPELVGAFKYIFSHLLEEMIQGD